MSNWNLVPDTLNYGRRHSDSSAVITLVLILFFIFSTFFMIKLHSHMSSSKKYSKGKRQWLKIIPPLVISTVLILLLFYFINRGINNTKPVWQSDYFVAFTVNFVVMIISFASYISTTTMMETETKKRTIPHLRRKFTQYFINGVFKTTFFFFWTFILTPYFVLCVGYGETLRDGLYAWLSLLIFILFCVICYFTFGRSPFAPLLPTVVLWGACISYYSLSFAAAYAIAWNCTSFALAIAGFLFGFGFFAFLEPRMGGMKGLTTMIYIALLWLVIAGVWLFIWWYYGIEWGGQGYEKFHRESFVPS